MACVGLLLHIASDHQEWQHRKREGHEEYQRVIGRRDRQENARESYAHRARHGPGRLVPGEGGRHRFLSTMLGD